MKTTEKIHLKNCMGNDSLIPTCLLEQESTKDKKDVLTIKNILLEGMQIS